MSRKRNIFPNNYSKSGVLGFLGMTEAESRNASAKAAAIAARAAGDVLTPQQQAILTPQLVTAADLARGQQLAAQEVAMTQANIAPMGVNQAQWDLWTPIWNATKPNVVVSSQGAGNYVGLPTTHLSFANDTLWPQPILEPHFTTAVDWCLAGGTSGVLNKGNPRSVYDPVEYLRSALVDSDWDRVYYWFAVNYGDAYAKQGNAKTAFFPYADMNIYDYKYVIDSNGNKVYFPLSLYDVQQFLIRIVANFTIADVQHSSGGCTIGLIEWIADPPTAVDVAAVSTNQYLMWMALHNGLFTSRNGNSSVFQYESLTDIVASATPGLPTTGKPGASPRGNLRVGWIQGPPGEWQAGKIIAYIVLIVASYGIGYLSAPAVAATEATEVAAVEATGSVATAVGAGALDTLETVVVNGAVTSALSSAATGAIFGAAAVPVLATTSVTPTSAVNSTTNIPSADTLDTVVVNGAVNTSLVSPSTGAIFGAATVPVLATTSVTPTSTVNSTTNIANPDTLDTVVVNGAVNTSLVSPLTGATIATAAVPVAVAATDTLDTVEVNGNAPSASVPVNPAQIVTPVAEAAASAVDSTAQNSQQNGQQNQQKSLQDQLAAWVEKYGLAYVKKYLVSLLKGSLGRNPTAGELSQASGMLDAQSGSTSSLVMMGIAAAIIGVVLVGVGGSKK
jgi:hypothetical protein